MCSNESDEVKKSAYRVVLIQNIALFALIGLACFVTHSAWPLFGLVFVFEAKTKDKSEKKDEQAL